MRYVDWGRAFLIWAVTLSTTKEKISWYVGREQNYLIFENMALWWPWGCFCVCLFFFLKPFSFKGLFSGVKKNLVTLINNHYLLKNWFIALCVPIQVSRHREWYLEVLVSETHIFTPVLIGTFYIIFPARLGILRVRSCHIYIIGTQ